MFVKVFHQLGRELVVASFTEGRAAVADLQRRELLLDVQLPECPWAAIALDDGASRLFTAYQYTRGVDVWDANSGDHSARVGKYRAVQLAVDRTGTKLVMWGYDNGVLDVATGNYLRIARLSSVYGAMLDSQMNWIWVPLEARSVVGRLRLDALQFDIVRLATPEKIWTIRRSPDGTRVILLQCRTLAKGRESGTLACVGEIGDSPSWELRLRGGDVTSNGSFTGDSRYFLLNGIQSRCVIVVNVATGVESRRIDVRADPAYPLSGASCMASDGRVIDAETGAVSEGVSKASWWRSAGLSVRQP